MRLPKAGSVLELVDIMPMNIRGQGIAWDRSQPGVIYGIIRATAKEKAAGGNNKVTVFRDGREEVAAGIRRRQRCRHAVPRSRSTQSGRWSDDANGPTPRSRTLPPRVVIQSSWARKNGVIVKVQVPGGNASA